MHLTTIECANAFLDRNGTVTSIQETVVQKHRDENKLVDCRITITKKGPRRGKGQQGQAEETYPLVPGRTRQAPLKYPHVPQVEGGGVGSGQGWETEKSGRHGCGC